MLYVGTYILKDILLERVKERQLIQLKIECWRGWVQKHGGEIDRE